MLTEESILSENGRVNLVTKGVMLLERGELIHGDGEGIGAGAGMVRPVVVSKKAVTCWPILSRQSR